jgi:hypothetical protein
MFKSLKKLTNFKIFIDFKHLISKKYFSFKKLYMEQIEQINENPIKETKNIELKKEKILVNNNKMKLNKKLAQGIKVLCQNEKKEFSDLCQEELSKDLFVIHFGNGYKKSNFICLFGLIFF